MAQWRLEQLTTSYSFQIGDAILRSDWGLSSATAIGKVIATPSPVVILNSKLGTTRVLDLLSGEQLPL
jgi:hydrogenase maturation factor